MRFPRRPGFIAFVLCALTLLITADAAAQCSGDRWSIKTGTDVDASTVDLNNPTLTTMSYLTGLQPPSPIPVDRRAVPTEETVWVLSATLTNYKAMPDGDFHLVLSDGAGHTMLAEIPSPGCVGANSPFADGIAHARQQLENMFTPTSGLQAANIPVRVTGVGMFDYYYGQAGEAPNDIELHPVIDIIFNPPSGADFSLTSASPSVTVAQNGAVSNSVAVSFLNGFTSTVSLSVSGLPDGATAVATPAAVSSGTVGYSNLAITAGSATPTGSYNLTIAGSGGGKSHSLNLILTVVSAGTTQLMGNTGFENTASMPSPWVTTPGVIDNSVFRDPHTGNWKAWMGGYGSAHTDTIQQSVSIPSGAGSASLRFWMHIDTAETSTRTAYDTATVQIRNSSGTVLSTLATFSNLSAAAGYRQFSFDVSQYIGKTIQVYATSTEDSSLQTSFIFDDFELSISGATAPDTTSPQTSVTAPVTGATVSGTVSATATATDNVGVTTTELYIDNALATSVTNAGTLTFSWDTTKVTNGSHTLYSKAYDAAGNSASSAQVTVSVSNSLTTELIVNGGFENSLSPWIVGGAKVPVRVTTTKHGGASSVVLGATTTNGKKEPNGDSFAFQSVTIPAGAKSATLSFWYSTYTTDTIQYDWQEAKILDANGNTLAQIFKLAANNPAWTRQTFDLTPYVGRTIRIYFNCHGDGYTDPTTMWVDDVSVSVSQ